ncbi:MAG: MarR family transcriptional regulator [Bdellovibrio sp.]|nr:MarR family transcriptional regulator [Bdellovibrio sp.]
MDSEIAQLVRESLSFHNLNKVAEIKLGLSLVQYYFLVTLRDMPGCSPQELAKAIGMHPSTLTQSMKRLQKKEAIFVGEDPKDSRKKILSMTRKGSEQLKRFSKGIGLLLHSKEYSTLSH